jgi:hypothetical protein
MNSQSQRHRWKLTLITRIQYPFSPELLLRVWLTLPGFWQHWESTSRQYREKLLQMNWPEEMCLHGCRCLERCKNRKAGRDPGGKSKGVSEIEPNIESAEPNGGELANIVSKIPGSSRFEEVNDWLKVRSWRPWPPHHDWWRDCGQFKKWGSDWRQQRGWCWWRKEKSSFTQRWFLGFGLGYNLKGVAG